MWVFSPQFHHVLSPLFFELPCLRPLFPINLTPRLPCPERFFFCLMIPDRSDVIKLPVFPPFFSLLIFTVPLSLHQGPVLFHARLCNHSLYSTLLILLPSLFSVALLLLGVSPLSALFFGAFHIFVCRDFFFSILPVQVFASFFPVISFSSISLQSLYSQWLHPFFFYSSLLSLHFLVTPSLLHFSFSSRASTVNFSLSFLFAFSFLFTDDNSALSGFSILFPF